MIGAITDEDIAAFRQNAEAVVIEATREGCAAEIAAWAEIALLGDADVTALLRHGAVDRGWGSAEILAFVAARNSGHAPKRVRGLGAKTLALRTHIEAIFGSFDGSMSTRQVFYQCVSRGACPNDGGAYETVARLIVAMRRDGTIAYDRVVDRTRRVHKLAGWAGVREAMSSLASQYRRDPWDGQGVHVHVAVEKQALEGVFADVADQWGAPLYVTRGFASETFVYDWSRDIIRAQEAGHRVAVIFFGDCDPDGWEIEADAQRRLAMMGARADEWERAGLHIEDLNTHDLIALPVKRAGSRAAKYLARFGDRGAELDALPPDVLRERIDHAITSRVDTSAWDQTRTIEAAETESLDLVAGHFDEALAAARSAA